MNFQNIKPIESAENILDLAFSTAKKEGELIWMESKNKNRVIRTKNAEITRLNYASKIMVKRLNKIYSSFPKIIELPEVYVELISHNLDLNQFKISLSKIKKSFVKIKELENFYVKSIKNMEDTLLITKQRNSFYARSSSIMNKISKDLKLLEKYRHVLKKLPDLKEDLFTIVICGYPNVGKSTLLNKLTNCNVKISNYSFTTTNINVGYLILEDDKIQLVDVPGTFNRDKTKMNYIEKNAITVIEKGCDIIFFLIDVSEYCGYSVDEQIKLFNRVLKLTDKKIILILNKIDLCSIKQINDVKDLFKENLILEVSLLKDKNIDKIIKLIKKEKK
ncbi:MAG: GTPase [Nanoarchaeota archaeon]